MALYSLKTGELAAWENTLEDYIALHKESTAKKDRGMKAEFERWAGKKLIQATEADALAYTSECLKRKGQRSTIDEGDSRVAPWTVLQKIGRLSCMTDFLIGNGFMNHNPWGVARRLLHKAQPGEKRPTNRLSDEQIIRLLETPNTRTPAGKRDHAILALLFGSALRISEVLKITMQDVSEGAKGSLLIRLRRTKAGRDQNQVLQGWVSDIIKSLVVQRRAEGATAAMPLVTIYYASGEPYNTAVSYHGVRKWFKRWLRDAGLPEIASTHWGRASAITSLYEKGVELRQLQKFARHSSALTTERYIKTLVSEDIDELPQRLLDFRGTKKD